MVKTKIFQNIINNHVGYLICLVTGLLIGFNLINGWIDLIIDIIILFGILFLIKRLERTNEN